MWNALAVVREALAPYRDLLVGSAIGSATSIVIAELYFQRQRRRDKEKEKAEVLLRFEKLTRAYKRHFLSSLGRRENEAFPDYVKDAMVEYRTYHDIYRQEGDVAGSYSQAMKLAQMEMQEHPKKFEMIIPADAHKEVGKGME